MKCVAGWLAGLLLALPGIGVAAKPAPPVPLLWEVRGDADARLLMLGSFHLLKAGDYPLSADVERAFSEADRVIFELGPDEMGSPLLARQLLQAAMRKDGTRLEQTLSPAQWQGLEAWSARHALPVASLQGLQPWFVALNINLSGLADAGMRADLGLDVTLMERAKAAGKPVLGLEDGRTQIALFTTMDSRTQGQMLDEALAEAASGSRQMQALHAAWRTGNAALLWQQSGQEMRESSPALYQSLNVQRNQAWLARLPSWLEAGKGTTLVVVGSMHLLGEEGLVAQFQARGRSVRRLCTVSGCRAVMAKTPAARR